MAEIVPAAELTVEARDVVESLRDALAKAGFGVTLHGAHLTVRWRDKAGSFSPLRQVTLVVDAVDDGEDELDAELVQ